MPGGVQGLDRYAYVGNNPVAYVDPSGHMPIDNECGLNGEECKSSDACTDPFVCPGFFLVGSPEDIQAVLDILNTALSGTGYTVSANQYGGITFTQTGGSTFISPEQQALIDALTTYTNVNVNFAIKVSRNGPPGTLVDCYPCGELYIDDIEAFGTSAGVSSLSTLIHSFEEQYQRQVNGLCDTRECYLKAHALAVVAEEAVAGADRVEDYGGSVGYVSVFLYDYGGGCYFYTAVIPTDPITVQKINGCMNYPP